MGAVEFLAIAGYGLSLLNWSWITLEVVKFSLIALAIISYNIIAGLLSYDGSKSK